MKKRRLLSVLTLTCLLPLSAQADVWQDPETNVNYEYTVGESEASVMAGNDSSAGSPNISGDITICSQFTVDGNEYSVTTIGDYAFCRCRSLTSVTIPNSVTSIGNNAFYECSGLTFVTIPNSVTTIGVATFSGCSSLTSATIPNSVTTIGSNAFINCHSLISIEIPYSVTVIEWGTFASCRSLTSVIIPNSVTEIDSWAFLGCRSLTNIIIPNSVRWIGHCAFRDCNGLTSITIPNSVKSIPLMAFAGCSNLTSITIPNSVTNIGESAFQNCSGLTSITIPNSVTSIGNSAFSGCSGLTEVISMVKPFEINIICWENVNTDEIPLYVPYYTKSMYESTAGWNVFKNIVEMEAPAGVSINAASFPDKNFRDWVLNQYYGIDGILTEDEIANVKVIDVSGKSIEELKGVELFKALTRLNCRNNQLTALDVSQNEALTELDCEKNQLTSLDVSQNEALLELNCDDNRLTSLDVSNNMKLKKLSCYWNPLTSLDLSKNTALTSLACGNQLSSLDLSKNTALTSLVCSNNLLTTIDLSNNIALEWLDCSWNLLTSLDVSKNTALKHISCEANKIKGTAMDALIASLPNTTDAVFVAVYYGTIIKEQNVVTKAQVNAAKAKGWVTCYNNNGNHEYEGSDPATEGIAIDEVNFPDENFRNWILSQDYGADGILTEDEIMNVTSINVSGKSIADLTGIGYFTALTVLSCGGNQLTSLDVSNNTALTSLECYSNQLTSLNVSNNTALTTLYCFINQLASLDVSSNTALTSLSCYSNQLTSLDVSSNTALTWLYCDGNQLTSLNVSKNTELKILSCCSNEIKGVAMDALITSLPNTTDAIFVAVEHYGTYEKNVVTKAQVEAAKEKGWKTYDSWWTEYEGSDPVLPKITINANGGQVYYNKEEIDNTIETFDIEEGLNRLFFPTDTILKITVNGEDVTSQLTLMDAVISSVDEFGRTRDKRIADVPSLLITPTGQNLQVDIEFVGDRQVIQEDGILYVIDGSEAYVAGATDCPENLVLPSSVTNGGKSYKIIGLIPKCFSYWKELKSVSLPESLKYVTVGAFFVCENLENVEISSNVEYIGEFAFYYNKIKTIKVFAKDPIKCFGFDNDVFNSVLYVPKGCKTKYENADFWKYFKTIVEMGIVPVDEGQTIDIGNEITENTDLDGNVVGNIYYSISSGDGSYNPTEGCLVLTKPTNDLAINLYDIFSEYFKEQFNGLAFKLAPGKGSIKVEAETQGNMVLKVKIGNNDPIEMELDGKLKVKFPYNVNEETLVYIYGGMSTAGAKATGGTRASSDADLLKIYGFEIVSDASGIEATESGLPANADAPVYNLNGQRVDTPTKGIYIKNGRKVLVK